MKLNFRSRVQDMGEAQAHLFASCLLFICMEMRQSKSTDNQRHSPQTMFTLWVSRVY